MISKKLKFLLVFTLGVFLLSMPLNAESKDRSNGNSLSKPNGNPIRAYLNINNLSTVIKNDGISDIDKDEKNSGLVYPKGSGKTAVYISGFLWGCYIGSDPQARVGGSAYRSSMKAGKIISPGVAESPELPKNRIYRVRPDVYPGGPSVDLSMEANDEKVSQSAIREQYEKDWTEWPAADGAPYIDKNKNGQYDPASDVPGVAGANQTIWYVANDIDAQQSVYLYGTNPCGVELQVTMWAYSQTGALGNMFFRKYKMINKSTNALRDVYVSMWSDVDLGNSSDDFVGCDTTLSLGFCYNANAADATYSPLPPPAVGFDFFQGPMVKGIEGQDLNKNGVDDAADYANKDGMKVGPGYINLPMTSFYYFARGDASVTDPTQGDPQGATQFYNFFQGKIGLTGKYFVDPNTQLNTTYVMAGDPQTRKGWVDGQVLPAGDRRQGQASGPFQMAVGDTQEIVVAEIVAGAVPGMDRLSAIGLLKFYDQQAQLAYDNNFDLPVAPPAPEVNISTLDKRIILDWGSNFSKVQATETSDAKGYKFQGYNVYQLPSATASVSEGKRIATFDIIDGVGKIEDKFFDPNTGVVAVGVRQFGNDTGIKRYLDLKNDELKGGTPLINGIKYYYAVTSYSYNTDPNAVPNNLENPLAIMTIVPQSDNPGTKLGSIVGDTVKVTHSKGISEGMVIPIVVDPPRLTGDTYKVTFDTLNGATVWSVTNVTKGKVVVSKQANQTGDDDYFTVDGMVVKVTGPAAPGMKDYLIGGTRRWTWSGADGFALEGFNGAIGNAYHNWFSGSTIDDGMMKNVLIKLAATDADGVPVAGDPNISYAYRYMRSASAAPAKPEFAPFIVNKGAGYAFQDFKNNFPFSAWDIEANPPRRLAVGYMENNRAGGLVDGKYWPPLAGVDNTGSEGGREFFFIFDNTYQETQDPNLAVDILNVTTPMQWMATVNRRAAGAWAAGDEVTILANHINLLSDEFTFTAPSAASYSADKAKEDVNRVNVFPNPYYGTNSEELNKYNRFVTFSHLPTVAKIKIFNLAGVLVKTIDKNSTSQFERWNLANNSGLPVASGLYIAYIEMPDLGVTKILKLAIIQEQQILDRF